MRATSSTRVSGVSSSTRTRVRPLSTFLLTLKWTSAKQATCGRWVTARICPPSASRWSLRPSAAASAPPMPVSTSSNTRLGRAPRSSVSPWEASWRARWMRDSSPPEAMRASGPRLLSRVRSEQEDHLVDAVAAEVDRHAVERQGAVGPAPPLQGHAQAGAAEPEVLELAFDALDQRLAPALAGLAKEPRPPRGTPGARRPRGPPARRGSRRPLPARPARPRSRHGGRAPRQYLRRACGRVARSGPAAPPLASSRAGSASRPSRRWLSEVASSASRMRTSSSSRSRPRPAAPRTRRRRGGLALADPAPALSPPLREIRENAVPRAWVMASAWRSTSRSDAQLGLLAGPDPGARRSRTHGTAAGRCARGARGRRR